MIEIKIPEGIMKKYLEEREAASIVLLSYERLGSGWHGTGYKIKYDVKGNTKNVILRTLRPVDFSHDYASDRAKVFTLQHELSNSIPKHISSIDVGGYAEDGSLMSLGKAKEYFQIVEVAYGATYVDDLIRILNDKKLNDDDIKKAKMLSGYLAELESEEAIVRESISELQWKLYEIQMAKKYVTRIGRQRARPGNRHITDGPSGMKRLETAMKQILSYQKT